MLRMSILSVYLGLVACIGLTFGPLEPLAYGLYNWFAIVGTNPSFTPITTDMSMMTSKAGENNFSKPLVFIAKNGNNQWVEIPPAQMDLYLLRIPIILFLEQAAEGVDLKEARFAICHQLKEKLGEDPLGFAVREAEPMGLLLNKEFSCDFAAVQ